MYAKIEGEWAEMGRYADKERFFDAIERYFSLKRGEGKAFDGIDEVLALLRVPTVVARNKIDLVQRALRHHDEIGCCAEIVDAAEEAYDAGAAALGWGADARTLETIAPHDFGDMRI